MEKSFPTYLKSSKHPVVSVL